MNGLKAMVDNQLKNHDKEINFSYNKIRCLEPLISADLGKMANELGTQFAGLEYSVKTASSVEDKLKREKEELSSSIDDDEFDP